ncbi:MAG: hypothetical protein D8M59_00280 [Planctomycetes bacterium]|nr:hypothetical protein [Planctomycetota bacterium]
MLIILSVAAGFGCATQSPRLAPTAVNDVQQGRYLAGRDGLRRHTVDRTSPDVILDNLRMAVAALHDGAYFEAQQALQRAYPFMVSGSVNAVGSESAVMFQHEGTLVWKGEPFEQAMAWYYQTVAQMVAGDWENARAASRNMLFTLVDFAGGDNSTIDGAMEQAESPEWFDEHASEVESDLVIGYLLAGISERWQDRPTDAAEYFNRARTLAPELDALTTLLETGSYNTLLVVEAMPGPRKEPVGEYGETFVYRPKPGSMKSHGPPLVVTDETGRLAHSDQTSLPETLDVVDTWSLAQHPRWWSLKSLRESKKVLGDVLTLAGTGAVIYGSTSNDANSSDKALIAGAAAMLLGQALSHGSAADLRHFDVLPRYVYLVPLALEPGFHTLRFTLPQQNLDVVRHDLMPGYDSPAVYVIRLSSQSRFASLLSDLDPGVESEHDATARIARSIAHPNDHTGPIVGTFPYILGGTCVCIPSADVLAAYHAGGYLLDLNLEQLRSLYRAEGIVFDPLPLSSETQQTWRHVLDGGRLLYTPLPGSAGYERLTYSTHRPYEPGSEVVREARDRLLGESPTMSSDVDETARIR